MTPLKLLQKNIDFVVLGTVLAIPGVVLLPLVLAYFLIIAPDDGEASSEAENAPTLAVSNYAAAIATVNAAPVRTAAPPSISGAGSDPVSAANGYTPDMISVGQSSYLAVCTACHGTDARGISGLGKDLITSEFVHTMTDQELLAFIIKGRDIWDPANTTGVQMPARGGNPGLTDNDILNIVAYLRVVSGNPGAGVGTTVASTGGGDTGTTSNPVDATPVATTDPNAPSPSDEWVPPALVPTLPSDTGSDTGTTAATNENGPAVYAEYCGDPLNTPACEFLQTSLADGTLTEDQVTDLLINGTSPFDNPYPVTISQRGGMLMMSDDDVAALVSELKVQAGVAETPAATDGETTTPSDGESEISQGRDGETLYAAFCEADDTGKAICEYLLAEIAAGNLDDDQLFELLTLGTPLFDNPYPVTIPQRGGNLILSDIDVTNLINTLKEKAGVEVGAAMQPPPFITVM
ncbi:MAG: cytochrome c [Anaerolineae bacterium]|nr:cytochrome c [Anaerolineae bacterium]